MQQIFTASLRNPAGENPVGGGGCSNGQVAMSALGSGHACPTAVIAFCPSCLTACQIRYHSHCEIIVALDSSEP